LRMRTMSLLAARWRGRASCRCRRRGVDEGRRVRLLAASRRPRAMCDSNEASQIAITYCFHVTWRNN
jgi:hypothetical protein